MAEMFLLSPVSEAVISLTIGRVLEQLISNFASPNANAVLDQVNSLSTELRRIQSYLNSQHAQDLAEDHSHWVSELRDLACEIEDIIDTFIVITESSSSFPRFVNFFRLRKLHRKIAFIKKKVDDCYGNKDVFEVAPSTSRLRRSYPDEDEDEDEDDDFDLVGQGEAVEALMARVMEERKWLHPIPILGMGGLGKTALAKKVYNDIDTRMRFDRRAWVLVSQSYVARDVFGEILRQVSSWTDTPVAAMEERELVRLIREELRGKRYLVVLDDVWRVEDFDSIRRVFPKDQRTPGSKLLFTTQMVEVARAVDLRGSSPIQPEFLCHESSWELLRSRAFPVDVFGERHCPSVFEEMGREMVKKCGGLPLAVVVLGGILRTKNTEKEWREVERDVNSHLNGHNSGLGRMLALSYHDLPYYLKPCLLYLGCFPEDWEIPTRQLIQLWIAEGLIITPDEPSTSRGQRMEEIAERYLIELVNRCMVQVGNRDYTGEGMKTCRVHHLMRDFCVFKARKNNFCHVIQRHEMMEKEHLMPESKSRRVAILPGCGDLHPNQMHPVLRSLMYFKASAPAVLEQFLRSGNLKMLRVLDFGFNRQCPTQKCNVPAEIGDLIHLRYLGLRGGGRVKLPIAIEKLCRLTMINLRDNSEVVLPEEIFRLKRLKHLLLPLRTTLPFAFRWMTLALSDTTQIQTLKHIGFGPFLLKGKVVGSEWENLRNLGVKFNYKEEVQQLLTSPNFELGLIQSLHMTLRCSVGFSGLRPLSNQCKILSKLFLDGKLSEDCHALDFLPASLTKLILRGSEIRNDPMAILGRLPNLQFLHLENAYMGSKMECGAESFPKLETLLLLSMMEVGEWLVERNAMPNLKRLDIQHMPNLHIPEHLNVMIQTRN